MKLNLLRFFQLIEHESYVVIKPSPLLPDYKPGTDMDIFCYHSSAMIEKITAFLAPYVKDNSTIKVSDSIDKAHIDYIVNESIHFRFDIYKSLPCYKNILLKEGFYSSVIESAIALELPDGYSDTIIKVPAVIDDVILRYVEYHEYYAERPDKIKHIHYIEQKFANAANTMNLAFDKLHYYTAFPPAEYRAKTLKERFQEKVAYYQSLADKIMHLYKGRGLKAVLLKIHNKLKG